LEDASITSTTMSGEGFRGKIPAIEALRHETFPREGSEKVLGRITKKCERNGTCSIMGGRIKKTKRQKKNKKTRKTKRRKILKRTKK